MHYCWSCLIRLSNQNLASNDSSLVEKLQSRVAGWVAGWLDQMEIRLNSASVEVEVEVEAELGNNQTNYEMYTRGERQAWAELYQAHSCLVWFRAKD